MQTSIRSTTDSTQHGDLPRTENDGGKRLRSSLGLARDDDDDDVYKIDALDQWCLRKLLGIKWYHHVQNDDVRRKTEQPHLSATVQARHLSLFGHTARMPDESYVKQILTASPLENWRRPPGCPCTTWMKTTQQDLKSMNLSLNEAADVAQNRPQLMSTFGATHS